MGGNDVFHQWLQRQQPGGLIPFGGINRQDAAVKNRRPAIRLIAGGHIGAVVGISQTGSIVTAQSRWACQGLAGLLLIQRRHLADIVNLFINQLGFFFSQ